MALTKKDKKDIGEIVEVKVSKEIGFLRLEMNQRFDQTDKKIDGNHKEVLEKIDQIRKMESEDITVIYEDIAKIKKRLPA